MQSRIAVGEASCTAGISAFVYLSRGSRVDPRFEARGSVCWAAASRQATRGEMVVMWLCSTVGMLPSDLKSMRGQGWLAKVAGHMERFFARLWQGAGLFSVITTSWSSQKVCPFTIVLRRGVGEAGVRVWHPPGRVASGWEA